MPCNAKDRLCVGVALRSRKAGRTRGRQDARGLSEAAIDVQLASVESMLRFTASNLRVASDEIADVRQSKIMFIFEFNGIVYLPL